MVHATLKFCYLCNTFEWVSLLYLFQLMLLSQHTFLTFITPSIWNGPPAKKIIFLPARSTKLQFSRKRKQVPNNEPSNNIAPISIPKTTKCFVSPYPITYKKPFITPASQKMGAYFIKTSLSELILRPTHQRPNLAWTMQELGSAAENQSPYPDTSLINRVAVQVGGKRYATTRAWTEDFVVEVWCFQKMLASQNRPTKNVNSRIYQDLSLN